MHLHIEFIVTSHNSGVQVQNVFEPIVTDEGRMGPSFKLRLTGTRVRFITARTTN